MSKRAVILAGGKGQRLRPYTLVLPKPLMPIGEYPILEVVVRQLVSQGFDHITMALNHQANIIKAFFGDGSRWNIKIDYSLETKPLSTMGPLHLIHDLPENFLIMNGDILTDINFGELYDYHVRDNKIFTISSHAREDMIDYGVLETSVEDRVLTGFREKPRYYFEVSMGVYIANRKILDYIPQGQPFGFDHLMLKLLTEKQPVKVRKYEGIWLDIGRPDDYEQAINLFAEQQEKFLHD
jgi:NDP-sugar pyrophosphorylase family protein